MTEPQTGSRPLVLHTWATDKPGPVLCGAPVVKPGALSEPTIIDLLRSHIMVFCPDCEARGRPR